MPHKPIYYYIALISERSCACRMVDPLDGTTNFVHRWPFVCVSIGLTIKRKGQVGLEAFSIVACQHSLQLSGGSTSACQAEHFHA